MKPSSYSVLLLPLSAVSATAFLLLLLPLPLLCARSLHAKAPSFGSSEGGDDRQALLCLRSHLDGGGDLSSASPLATWRGDGGGDGGDGDGSFCRWRGVTCSGTVRRVAALELAAMDLAGRIPPCIANLSFLTRVQMTGNKISGGVPPELGRLARLRYLNLSTNSLAGVIPPALGHCSSLEQLDLGDNLLQGQIPHELALLPNLSTLILGRNSLSGSIPHSLGGSSPLTKLALDNNGLTGEIPSSVASSSMIAHLNLAGNKLTGEVPAALFNSLSLHVLNLSYNGFSGSMPHLSHASSPLEYLGMTSNKLSGIIPSSIGNFSSLSFLRLALNNLQGSIPASIGNIAGLQILDLTYNNLSGTVPEALYKLSSLNYLGLGANRLSGRIPTNIGYTLASIQVLVMQGNQFEGPVPASFAKASELRYLGLRGNGFNGVIPSLGSLKELVTLDLGDNLLEAGDWTFLTSLAGCTKLQKLYLDKNILQGDLPASIGNLPETLQWLLLNGNKITGVIPPVIGNLSNLTILHMERNQMSGHIPGTLGKFPNLFVLNLAENSFSGEIPQSIGDLENLSELYLQQNALTGSIPTSLAGCTRLITLNLSCNILHGSIPGEVVSISSLSEWLDLSYNQLTGPIPSEISHLDNLELLNLSNNQLSGKIPTGLGQCIRLESLRLEANRLEGGIPGSLMQLRGVAQMDLSQNNLSGEIPNFLATFSSLQLLNLSFNNLQGPVPAGGVFGNSSQVFIQGNKNLCTGSAMLHLQPCITSTPKSKKISYVIIVVVPLATIMLISLPCVIAIIYKNTKANKPSPGSPSPPPSKGLTRFSYHDLHKATGGFSSGNLVGAGDSASVYKAMFLADPSIAAVKVFRLDQDGASKSFAAECKALRNTRHRNLVRVISVCSTADPSGNEFKALVLEHMPNGNLQSWLHPEMCSKQGLTRSLSLGLRITVAADIAAAVNYLHNQCSPPLIHSDLKPSNVLLDDDMCAHVGDFGLTKFVHGDPSENLVGPGGTIGYIAPEYGMGSKTSTDGDVYSYGIILLEMITGKSPTDEMFMDGHSLHRFVQLSFPHKIDKFLEPILIPHYQGDVMVSMKKCVMQLTELGLKCSVDSPKDRPIMEEVYAEAVAIKDTFLALCD